MPEHDEVGSAATAVGALLAPVVACLRDDLEGYGVLVETATESPELKRVLRAAPTVARFYLKLAPPPGGARAIVDSYDHAAESRFESEIVAVGNECLRVAGGIDLLPAQLAEMAKDVFVADALDHGEERALEGAVASVWWCAYLSARLRGVDPIEEAAAVCRYAARVA